MSDKTSATTRTRTSWFKSSFSSPSQSCVEVRFDGAVVHVRDSKYRRNPSHDPTQEPTITITTEQWAILLDELADRAPVGANGALSIETNSERASLLRDIERGTTLSYTETEWAMFLAGVRAHEFDQPGLCNFPAEMNNSQP